MDCYFHSHVPSIAACTDCRKAICATCRDDMGTCPSCRLAAKVDAATAARGQIGGTVHQSAPQPPPGQPGWQQQAWQQQGWEQHSASAAVHAKAAVAVTDDPVESRALVALGYALWPLALISFLDRKRSKWLKRQAIQALGFNVGMAALYGIFTVLGNVFDSIPFISAAPDILRPLLIPVFLVGAVYFGVKAWQGQDVHVPVISDWLDERLPAN